MTDSNIFSFYTGLPITYIAKHGSSDHGKSNNLAHKAGTDLKSGSVGETYPITVSGKGNPFDGSFHWQVWNAGTGEVYGGSKSPRVAHRIARQVVGLEG